MNKKAVCAEKDGVSSGVTILNEMPVFRVISRGFHF